MEGLRSKLEQFNSSFKFNAGEFVKRLNETNQSRLINKIRSETDESLTLLEQERNLNFLSFIYFVRKEIDLAHECNSKVLTLNPKNMIAKANKAWFLVDNPKEVTNLEDMLAELDDLKQDRLINLVAKAEVAYTLARLGATQYRTADNLFREIHEECFNPHRSDDQIPEEYMYIWTFGYCMTQRRLLHVGNMPVGHEKQPSEQDYKRLLKTLLQVTSMERTLKPNLQKSRLYVELGETINIIERNKRNYPNGLRSIFTETEILSKFKPARKYIEEARSHQPKDYYILGRCGRYYRYVNELAQSISCLKESIDIKENSFSFHHLGLTYKKQLEMTIINKRNVNGESNEDCLTVAWTTRGSKSKQRTATERKQRESESQIKKFIKNPYYLLAIDFKEHYETVGKILDCFNKAVEITGNKPALYDKGLLLRQTGQFGKALEVFEHIIRDEDSTSTLINKANAYEQSALCIAGLINRNSGEDSRLSTRTMKIYLKSALEIACKLSCRIPKVKTCWNAATILKEIVQGQPDTKDKFEYLLIAYEYEENYEDLLKVLEELLECEPEVSKKAELVEKIVLCHTELNNFDEAVVLLEVFKNTYGIESIQETFYKSVNVKAGLHAFKAHETCKTSLRLRNAFDFGKTIKETGNEVHYDILILSNLNDGQRGHCLMHMLKQLGIEATSNEDIRSGQDEMKIIRQNILKSDHFVVISDMDDGNSHREEHLLSCIHQATSRQNITVVKDVKRPLPEFLGVYQFIEMDLDKLGLDVIDCSKDEYLCNNLIALLKKVLLCC